MKALRIETGSHLNYGLYHYRGFTLLYTKPKNGWTERGMWNVYRGIFSKRTALPMFSETSGRTKKEVIARVDELTGEGEQP